MMGGKFLGEKELPTDYKKKSDRADEGEAQEGNSIEGAEN